MANCGWEWYLDQRVHIQVIPAICERLLRLGMRVSPNTPEEVAQQVRNEQVKWKNVIELSGAKAS